MAKSSAKSKKRKELTKNQQEFKKQQDRLKRAIKRAKKQGYWYDEDVIPQMPKRVTKHAIESIKKLKLTDLDKYAEFVDYETGEILNAVEHRKEVKRLGIEKAKRTRERKKLLKSLREYEDELDELQRRTLEELENEIYGTDIDETDSETTGIDDYVDEYYNYNGTEDDTEYYPSYNIIDTIKERISSMIAPQVFERGRKGYVSMPIEERKNALLDILNDSVEYYGVSEYSSYLEEHLGEIYDEIDSIQYEDSDGEAVDASFANLGVLLNGKSLTPSQAESLSYMAELYD